MYLPLISRERAWSGAGVESNNGGGGVSGGGIHDITDISDKCGVGRVGEVPVVGYAEATSEGQKSRVKGGSGRVAGTGRSCGDNNSVETRSGRSRPKESKGKPKCRVSFSLLLERLCDGGKAG